MKTPKHVSLAVTIKNLTGSSQAVSILNRFGHTISYSELLELESSMAMKQLQKEKEGISLPSNIVPNVFTTFCWDNNDLNEQTLSGSGTTHCTNGILVQRRVHTCEPPPSCSTDVGPVSQSFESSSRRCRPGLLNVDFGGPTAGLHEPSKLNLGWFLPPTTGFRGTVLCSLRLKTAKNMDR